MAAVKTPKKEDKETNDVRRPSWDFDSLSKMWREKKKKKKKKKVEKEADFVNLRQTR